MPAPRTSRKRVGGRRNSDTRVVTLRLETELKEALKVVAEDQGASVTSLIESLALSNRSVKQAYLAASGSKQRGARVSTST